MCQNTSCQIVKQSRHRFERPLFILTSILSLLILLTAIGITVYKVQTLAFAETELVNSYKESHPEAASLDKEAILKVLPEDDKEILDSIRNLSLPTVLLAPLGLFLFLVYGIGKLYGGLHGDGIKAGPDQFGEVYALWSEMAKELGLKTVPDLYIQNGNGDLNAFATCIPGYRRFGAIYSDILERALATGDKDSLRFVLGHELGHIRLGHVYWWYFMLSFAGNLPGLNYILGLPLSRAREYGCDKVGLHLSQDYECKGLMMLAAGKHLYRKVDLAAYEKNQLHRRSLWVGLHNATIDHPAISWRIAALRQHRHGDLVWQKKPSSNTSQNS